ncbi:tRNA pseudouridine(13) synthase TruD [Alteromonas ponticola]|uniref:tRNA pseudouridine synthase D n=1 Tax=Alteromonas aquimaris TaxID=2998417 RepID=A0ABT3P9C4_9ALTE|nr:tRNA pseudouridine(13) synthase TruD [Alteromonas aquimaris]MCW8109310.1 tRNA pseudouridine(13) synthase TruD [Alteromonas aquimaris]
MIFSTEHWQYLYAKPACTAVFKQHPEDFIVEEHLGFTPTGEGEHQFIWVEKVNANTAFVAEQLAKFCNLPLRAVTYAGRKDKYALTRQWFGIHTPGKADIDFSGWTLPGVTVVKQTRHNKKLRTGQAKANHFTICLRNVSDPAALSAALEKTKAGVPNYFGEQRFGVAVNAEGEASKGGNLILAERMMAGEPIRNRNKRNIVLSALRSWLFNEVVSARIKAKCFESILSGDALMLTGSNSFFICAQPSIEELSRYQQGDLSPTGPLWGKGESIPIEEAKNFEQAVCTEHTAVKDFLATVGMEQERRAIKIWPRELEWGVEGDKLTVSFALPGGCFATSVLRECAVLHHAS